ncbi:uncharacterized protein LOC105690656 [Athalia rosae]|uniref:uncharacterized protein LOC105690656 n=1 Tax=Athalia rosae TaxID=37344 RepID=UPI0006258DB2|nr:uncharacterized protein LOC105690656 [Athalia rosae]
MLQQYVLTIFLAGLAIAEVPSYFDVCGRRNPNLNDCVLKSVVKMKDKLRNGIPELDIPSIEPLTLDEIRLADEPSFKAIAQNVKLYGFPDFEVKSLRCDLKNQRFDIEVSFKRINLSAEYDVATRVVVPIAGKGPINIIAEDVDAKVTLKYRLIDHKGAKYLFFPTMVTKLNIRDYTSHFVSREGSDGALAEGINAALSQSRQEILATIIPNLEKVVSERILHMTNRICKHFVYDEILPDRE